MIRPEPNFLTSFDALDTSLRALPGHEHLLPSPTAPDPVILDAWLKPYGTWNVPSIYLEFISHYGGVTTNIPPIGIGIRSLESLLKYRVKREAIGEVFETRFILLSHANIDGNLCLVFSDDDRVKPRVALMNGDDDITFVADSFGMYLWSTMFFLCTIHDRRHKELITFKGLPSSEIEPFNIRLAPALEKIGFELLGADSRTLCGQREDVTLAVFVRGPNISVSLGDRRSLHAVTEARADVWKVLEANQ